MDLEKREVCGIMTCSCGGKVGELSRLSPLNWHQKEKDFGPFYHSMDWWQSIRVILNSNPMKTRQEAGSVCWVGCLLRYWCGLEENFVVCFILSPSTWHAYHLPKCPKFDHFHGFYILYFQESSIKSE